MADPSPDWNKAYGAAGFTAGGGAVVRIIARIVNYRWPGLLDADTLGDLSMVVAACLAFLGAWAVPHSHS